MMSLFSPSPGKVMMRLHCDGAHGLFSEPDQVIDVSGHHPRIVASAAGWKQDSDRRWLGPCCSGKIVMEPIDADDREFKR